MKTYKAVFRLISWAEDRTVDVAAETFLEAWKKVKRLMRKTGFRCRLKSIAETAELDA